MGLLHPEPKNPLDSIRIVSNFNFFAIKYKFIKKTLAFILHRVYYT